MNKDAIMDRRFEIIYSFIVSAFVIYTFWIMNNAIETPIPFITLGFMWHQTISSIWNN